MHLALIESDTSSKAENFRLLKNTLAPASAKQKKQKPQYPSYRQIKAPPWPLKTI
jgi:hypothetical protein